MEYRDMLKDEIEQVLKVMAKVLSDISGIRSNGQCSATIEASTRELKNELDIDVEFMLGLTHEELINYINAAKLSNQTIINLADILVEMGKTSISYNKNKAKLFLEKSIELFDISNGMSSVFSINRMNKIEELNMLKDSL